MSIDAVHTVSLLGHRTRWESTEIGCGRVSGRHQHKQQGQRLETGKSIACSRNRRAMGLELSGQDRGGGQGGRQARSCGALYAMLRCWYFILCPTGGLGMVWMGDRIRFSHFEGLLYLLCGVGTAGAVCVWWEEGRNRKQPA